MDLKQTIKVLEEHNRWRRDNNVPAKTKMVDPKILGMALDRAIEELNKLLIPNVSHRNFCKQYHNRKESRGKLLMTEVSILPERDGNVMDIANELIREGWELTRIEDLSEYSEIMTERVKLVFHRWVDYGG